MNNSKNFMYTFWSIAIVLCLLLVMFALLFATISNSEKAPDDTLSSPPSSPGQIDVGLPSASPDASPDPNTSPDPNAPVTVSYELGETEDAGQEYLDKLTFLGDSTTYGLKSYGLLTGGADTAQVWTPANGTLALFNQSIATVVYPETGEEISIADAAGRKKPEYLVITLGVNGVASMSEEDFKRDYTALITNILTASPDTKIILNSIYPVTAAYDADSASTGISNAKIVTANGWIRQIAEDTGVKFVNAASVVTGADGTLPNDICNDAKLHLTAEGLNRVLSYLRTHAYQ